MKATRWLAAMVLVLWSASGGTVPARAEDKPAPPAKGAARADAQAGPKVNINEASRADLMKLEGVGPGMAQKIIAHREAHGRFKRVEDLLKVDGVGKTVLEKNAGRLTVK
jgi:competence protein ComEA